MSDSSVKHSGSAKLPSPYASDAWLLEGWTRSVPGHLEWRKGRLRFLTADAVLFDIAPAELRSLTFPWYYFGGGAQLVAAGTRYRLSFVRPNGAEYAVTRAAAAVGSPLALLGAADKVVDIVSGRRVGRRWRETLTALQSTN